MTTQDAKAGPHEEHEDYPLVMVEWYDASSTDHEGWPTLDDIDYDKLVTCASVGWLVVDNERVKAIVPSRSNLTQEAKSSSPGEEVKPTWGWAQGMRIPAPNVKSIVELVPGDLYDDDEDEDDVQEGTQVEAHVH